MQLKVEGTRFGHAYASQMEMKFQVLQDAYDLILSCRLLHCSSSCRVYL